MRTPSNRESQLTVQLTFKHAELTPFWYGWDGRAFLCFLGRDEDTDLYDLRHVYCGVVDIFGVIGEWAKEMIEDECLAHYTGQDPKVQRYENWGPVSEGGV